MSWYIGQGKTPRPLSAWRGYQLESLEVMELYPAHHG